MKKRLFFFIIIFNSLALFGLMLTQAYWVRHAYQLHKEQFNNSVRVSIKGVVNQMLNYHLHYHSHSDTLSMLDSDDARFDARQISPSLLDFKIAEEFNCMNIGDGYEYAIIDLRDQSIIAGNIKNHRDEVMASRHRISMTGFKDSEFIVLSVYIPQEKSLILNRIVAWLILSVLFSLSLIIAFFYTISLVLKQKRLSEVKADFINNMTHEFKTPLATISLASEMLMKKSVQDEPFRLHRYAQIIYDENSRLQNHVEQILRVSLLEKGQFN